MTREICQSLDLVTNTFTNIDDIYVVAAAGL